MPSYPKEVSDSPPEKTFDGTLADETKYYTSETEGAPDAYYTYTRSTDGNSNHVITYTKVDGDYIETKKVACEESNEYGTSYAISEPELENEYRDVEDRYTYYYYKGYYYYYYYYQNKVLSTPRAKTTSGAAPT